MNELRSKTTVIATGIRQECPLATILFILALTPLFRRVEATTELVPLKPLYESAEQTGIRDERCFLVPSPARLQ